jgi:hypothetical protein
MARALRAVGSYARRQGAGEGFMDGRPFGEMAARGAPRLAPSRGFAPNVEPVAAGEHAPRGGHHPVRVRVRAHVGR